MKRLKINHLTIAIIVALSLSLLTIIAITISTKWDIRHVYNVIYVTFLSFSVLSLNVLIFSKERKFIPNKFRKFLRVFFLVVYVLFYIIASVAFITAGQITRIQTILFLLGANKYWFSITIVIIIFLAVLAVATLLTNKSTLKDIKVKKDRKKIKLFLILNLILLIATILLNSFFLQIENPLITDDEELINYQLENQALQKQLANITLDSNKPNVVFILLESLSAERLGFYGYPRNVSPNIDALAEKSITFTNAYSTSTHSDYAQPGLLSSRYIFSSEYRNLFSDDNPRRFVWDLFKEDNYTTGYFSSQDDRWQDMNLYFNFSNLDNYSYSLTDGITDYGSGLAKKDLDHKTSELAVTWLNETLKEEEPFFLYLNFQATHNPMSYTDEYKIYLPDESINPLSNRGQHITNRYDNALTYVDAQVGKIINFLEETNQTDNTIIILTSDHGHDLENRHNVFGHGKSIYNEELIVPGIMFFPGVKPEIIEERVSQIDFVPTIIDLLGYPIPYEFQGRIMRENRPIYFVAQSHKYLIGMIQNNIKVIVDVNRELVEVYNLENDPEELINLDPKNYHDEILKLLFWHYCQKDYYEHDRWEAPSNNRCFLHNNFNHEWDKESVSLSPWDFFKNKF